MTTARLIIAITVLVFAGYIVVINWACVYVTWRNKRRGIDKYHSTVPVVSLLLTGVACVIYPLEERRWMAFIPLIDVGNWILLWSILWLPVVMIRGADTKNPNGPGGAPDGIAIASANDSNRSGQPITGEMKTVRLPALYCHANCPKCGLPTEFQMFESGLGGDFSTFVGATTGALYRLDLRKIHYQKIPESVLLAEAEKKEGKLIRVPEEIRCKICGTIFSGRWIPIEKEEMINAYEL